ncbi:hypothetical protein D049_1738A, partial [Vibrio parahaemolyticus VPTS-2010]
MYCARLISYPALNEASLAACFSHLPTLPRSFRSCESLTSCPP